MRQTPLYDEHVSAGGKIVEFGGWALPVQYSGILQEHEHTRTKASMFDCSHMGEFRIRGEQAVVAYDGLVTSDVHAIKVGRARYGMMLNENGGIIDDLITTRLSEDELYVVTNAGPLEKVSSIITSRVPGALDVTSDTAKIDLQGPLARDVLTDIGLGQASGLKYFSATRADWEGAEILVSRTGYTGELGYELYVPNNMAVALWRALSAHQDVHPAGLGARDTLRMEMGYVLSGQDFDESRTPLEAGLDSFVHWDGDFVGKDALLARRERENDSVLAPIRTADRRAPRHGFDVYSDDGVVGVVTSGTYGPSVGHGIGFAYVPRGLSAPGCRLAAGPRQLKIEIGKTPFYGEGTCRK